MTQRPRVGAAALLLALAALACTPAHATQYCDADAANRLSAGQKDRLFRLAAIVKAELDDSGAPLALIARSGLDLSRVQQRYSHAGISLRAGPETPWSVRQLYFACDAGRPLLFDQGMAAFVLGTDAPEIGYVSVVLLPPEAAEALQAAALDKSLALRLLGANYSANAFAFAADYQNCNQWVVELLAAAAGGVASNDGSESARVAAQRWLQREGYAPTVFDLRSRPWLWWAVPFVPWLHRDDHPADDLQQLRFRVSMPQSIDAFVQHRWPAAQRIEFCHDDRRVVIHRGWQALADGCVPGAQDTVVALD